MEKPSRIEKLTEIEGRPESLLGIFVKEPVAGAVKTRLTPPLRPEEAARLYETAMRETIDRFITAGFRVVLFYAGDAAYFTECYPGLTLIRQVEQDLGARMNHALAELLATGCRRAALIGSDSPDLPVEQVEDAFSRLSESDAVCIPADDGGYVLIGCSKPCPELFHDVAWSSSTVLETTRRRAASYGLSFAETGGWRDIDDIAALKRLLEQSPGSKTAQFAREKLSARLGPVE